MVTMKEGTGRKVVTMLEVWCDDWARKKEDMTRNWKA